MANKLEELALEFQAFNRLYADQLNRMIGKTNEIIAYLNSVRGDGTDVSGLIEDINEIKQAIYLLQETDVVISGDVETKYITLSGDNETKYAELVEMIENARCKFDVNFKTNITVGGIEAGTTINEGTELLDVLKDILKKVFKASINSYPSSTSTNQGDAAGDYEAGTTVSVKIKPTFTDGKFNTHNTMDSSATTVINAGCAAYNYTVQKKGVGATDWSNAQTGDSQFTYSESVMLTIPANATASTTSYRSIINYSGSTVSPKDSDLEYNTKVKIAASAATSSNVNYNAYYRWYVGQYDASTETFPTEAMIKALPSKSLAKSTTLTWNGDAKKHMLIVAVPAEFALTKALTSANESWLNKMKENSQTVTMTCASSSVTHDYKVYYFWNTIASDSLTISIEAKKQ